MRLFIICCPFAMCALALVSGCGTSPGGMAERPGRSAPPAIDDCRYARLVAAYRYLAENAINSEDRDKVGAIFVLGPSRMLYDLQALMPGFIPPLKELSPHTSTNRLIDRETGKRGVAIRARVFDADGGVTRAQGWWDRGDDNLVEVLMTIEKVGTEWRVTSAEIGLVS